VRKANLVIRKKLDAGLRELGITTPQYALLNELDFSPGLSNAELARKCFVTAQTMNVILVDLEKKELVLREAHPTNRKVRTTSLTPKGTRLILRARSRVEEAEIRLYRHLSEDEAQTLISTLAIIEGTTK
jgi:DNA-binding MarR family transcriptional regulator